MPASVNNSSEQIEYLHCSIFLRDDGIAVVDVIDEVILGKKETLEIIAGVGKLSKGKKVPVLTIFKPGNTADKGARDCTASAAGSQFTLADGFVIHNLPQKIIANFYLKINKPLKPTRFFSNENDALVWLKTFL